MAHFVNLFLEGRAVLTQNQTRKKRNIFPAVAKRGKKNPRHTDPVEQVGTEFSFRHQLLQIVLRGHEYPNVDFARFGLADTRYLSLLKNPQQAILNVYRNVANLIEKESPSTRRFEKANVVIDGSRESTPPMAE